MPFQLGLVRGQGLCPKYQSLYVLYCIKPGEGQTEAGEMGWVAGGLDISGRKMDGLTYTQHFDTNMLCLVLLDKVRKRRIK